MQEAALTPHEGRSCRLHGVAAFLPLHTTEERLDGENCPTVPGNCCSDLFYTKKKK